MATLRLMEAKTTLGFKIETTPYTVETLAAADFDFSVYNIQLSPEIETYMRKLSRGDLSQDTAVMGRRMGSISFSVDFHRGSSSATPPQYFQMLRACGMKQTIHGATGVSLVTHGDYDRVPATIEVVYRQEGTSPKQLVLRFKGAMGNSKLILDQVGNPIRIDFEFKGPWVATETREYASIITPTGFDSALPDACLSATVNLFSTEQFLGGFTIDLGNDVQLFSDISDPSGYHGARIVGRDPKLEIDPDMLVTDDINLWTRATSNETGELSITVGQNLMISGPALQIEGSPYKPTAREGHMANGLTLGFKRSLGNDELEILQGSKS